MAQIIVEVAEVRAKHHGENTGLACALAEKRDPVPVGSVRIGREIKATAARRKGQAAR